MLPLAPAQSGGEEGARAVAVISGGALEKDVNGASRQVEMKVGVDGTRLVGEDARGVGRELQ